MVKYGIAQSEHIRKTWAQIDANPKTFFSNKDWRNIIPNGGRYVSLNDNRKLHVASFDVKPIACWVPHLLIPNFIPSCPHCGKCKYVDHNNHKWITTPKILFGVRGHRYLDTKLYYCRSCDKRFAGYNMKSLQLDSKHILGFFNFNLSHHFAVNNALYSDIVNSANQPMAQIYQRLAQNVTDQYLSDHQYYLYAVKCKKVKVNA
jgi:hypothetical protein